MSIIQLGNSYTPSFEDPIAMLLACHDKIRRFCSELALLPNHVAEHGWDELALNSAERICQYFNQAAPLHHLDEEADLFPAYLPLAHASDLQLMQQLSDAHHVMEQTWQRLNTQLSTHNEPLSIEDIQSLRELYEQHMSVEEPLFGRIQAALQADVLHRLGQSMADRRK